MERRRKRGINYQFHQINALRGETRVRPGMRFSTCGERYNQKIQNPKLIIMGTLASEVSVRLQKKRVERRIAELVSWCAHPTTSYGYGALTLARSIVRRRKKADNASREAGDSQPLRERKKD